VADLRLRIEGERADSAAAVLGALLVDQFGQNPERHVETEPRREGDRIDPATGLAIAALVLALPGAINDAVSLAERAGLLDRLRRLIGAAKEEERRSGVTVRVETADGLRDVMVMSEGELYDALVVVRRKG
jgi:hypothetical protein